MPEPNTTPTVGKTTPEWLVCAFCGQRHRPLRQRSPRSEPDERNAYVDANGDMIAGGRDFDGEYD
jgi:hypothetical protein